MRPFTATLKTRQGIHSIKRLFSLLSRYGLSSLPMERKVKAFLKKAKKATFPITANLVDRYPVLFQTDAEFAVHGYRHTDYSGLEAAEQERHLEKSFNIFQRRGLEAVGFRAPYLKTNADTLRLLKKLGFLYDGSAVIHWNLLPANRQNDLYRRALEHYRPWDSREKASLPFYEEGMLRLPVSLPDDEMLIDRLGIRNQVELFEIWAEILHQCHQRDEMFVLLLHPERYFMAAESIDRLIAEAERKGMWRATLREIALWWASPGRSQRWPHDRKGTFCITGDIDLVSLRDLFR